MEELSQAEKRKIKKAETRKRYRQSEAGKLQRRLYRQRKRQKDAAKRREIEAKTLGEGYALRGGKYVQTISFDGLTLSISEWAKKLGLTYSTIGQRLKKGWSIERTLSTLPIQKRKGHYCLKGHALTPDNITKTGRCRICRELYNSNYVLPEKSKIKIAETSKKYRESDRGKAATEAFQQSRKYIATRLGIKESQVTDELYEMKLITLNLKRKIGEKNGKNNKNHNR